MGGLFEDGARTEPMGFIRLAEWFDALIEPWVDFVKMRVDKERWEKWTTFNRIPLSVDVGAGGGNGASSSGSGGFGGGGGGRRIAPVKRKRRGSMVNHSSHHKHYNHYHNSNGIDNGSSSNGRVKRMRK